MVIESKLIIRCLKLAVSILFMLMACAFKPANSGIRGVLLDGFKQQHIRDTTVILWTAEKGRMMLNEKFLHHVTDVQRAAIGYIATQCGNDCRWDGPKKKDESNLQCKLLAALNLGYMCSSTHLTYLRQWFRKDEASLEVLQYCSKKPADDPITDKFISIAIITEGEMITIIYEAKGRNLEDISGWSWTRETVFEPGKDNSIKVVKWQNLHYYRFKL